MAILYDQALALVQQQARSHASDGRTVPIQEAVGAICAEIVTSSETLPRYTNSAVDGFSISTMFAIGQRTLPVRGMVIAGDAPITGETDSAYSIMTGAPVPQQHDAVVKIEDVTVARTPTGEAVEVTIPEPHSGLHLRKAGLDFMPGTPIIARGERVRPAHVLALAALGVQAVHVARVPRIAIVATGGELSRGAELAIGQIRNATSPYLQAALETFGAEVHVASTVGDDALGFRNALNHVLDTRPDVVVTTGAVSMGVHDFVPTAVKQAGGTIVFHRAAIRPGGPILFATLPDGIPLFGLPGNPLSTVIGARFFIVPYLRKWFGMLDEQPIRARLAEGTNKTDGLRCFFKSVIDQTSDDAAQVTVLPGQESFLIRPLLGANAWVVLPEVGNHVERGTWVSVYPIDADD